MIAEISFYICVLNIDVQYVMLRGPEREIAEFSSNYRPDHDMHIRIKNVWGMNISFLRLAIRLNQSRLDFVSLVRNQYRKMTKLNSKSVRSPYETHT